MCCVWVLIVLAFPRLALVLMYLFTNYLERAYASMVLPLLGFLFLPLTTIAWAWMVNEKHPLGGIYLILLILAVLADLGGLGGGEWGRRRR